ncbi:hypothetical protein [Aerosakkonema funiforme]|uniref:Uncharacterized protein n=1 Tax=Aerosakkonema funiforme FACHB-1375 TaxID=2949571 RepID=A0A926ZGW6_9CYAN|nr:hypothetical protein [Aerosakkonema funiforme]MBD2180261.1 hypothetical protein [Aerosakkonema funiforme FACHB-1375]
MSDRRFVMLKMNNIVSGKRAWVSLSKSKIKVRAIALSFLEAIALHQHRILILEMDKIMSKRRSWVS